MQRPSVLNDDHCGFHARSILQGIESARKIMGLFPKTKGYSNPTLDNEGTMLVLEKPVEAINLQSHNRSEDGMSLIPCGATKEIIPYQYWREDWKWERVMKAYDEEKWLRWKLEVIFDVVAKEKIGSLKANHSWYCTLKTNPWDPTWWLYLSSYQDRTTSRGKEFAAQIHRVKQAWIDDAGLGPLVTLSEDEESRCCYLEVKDEPLLPPEHNRIQVQVVGPGGDTFFTVPRGLAETVNIGNTLIFPQTSLPLAVTMIRDLLNTTKPLKDGIDRVFFNPPVSEVGAFREWAEPHFDGPWLQYISGWAIKTPSPDDIDDSLPDWSLLPVAHFKILGSWRVVTVVKEPGGWRFHVTGKYTKDPLKHRHIRDELARKAGMTSETLWEPQEVGEGWLGVPG